MNQVEILKSPVTYHAELIAYDVRKRRAMSLNTEIMGVVHARTMTEALVAAKRFFPGYWFVTPVTQRRAHESEPKH